MRTTVIHVNMPAGHTDWTEVHDGLRKRYSRASVGQLSRTVAYPECDDECFPTEDGERVCEHRKVMRYSATVRSKP